MKNNPILGQGELLLQRITPPGGGGEKVHPYSLEEGVARFTHQLKNALDEVNSLDPTLCPDNKAALQFTMHPAYIAKSYMPHALITKAKMEHLGTRKIIITPEKIVSKGAVSLNKDSKNLETAQVILGSKRNSLELLYTLIERGDFADNFADVLRRIEQVNTPDARSKLSNCSVQNSSELHTFETVLHMGKMPTPVQKSFFDLLNNLGVTWSEDYIFKASGLLFIPFQSLLEQAEQVARHSYVRMLRNAPTLRSLPGQILRASVSGDQHVDLPSGHNTDSEVVAAVFDGGLPDHSPLNQWCDTFEPPNIGYPTEEYLEHGNSVTSALLFGPLGDSPAALPNFRVHHHRVLDDQSGGNGNFMIYDVLNRISDTLSQSSYQFVNISLGPDISAEDDEPNAWTSVLDNHFSNGETLTTVAGGNTGNLDSELGLNKIQPPADGVNIFSVGASATHHVNSPRADYSSVGPGKSPGIVRPEAINFGGSDSTPFRVFGADSAIYDTAGTSFAAPYTLKTATEVSVAMGDALSIPAIKSLLINHAGISETPDKAESGWGVINNDVGYILNCNDDEIKVIYQGVLYPATYQRTPIPLPSGAIEGMVDVKVTLCMATEIDSEDPFNYTRSGVGVTFRPQFGGGNKKTRSFFKANDFVSVGACADESKLRNDALKWETTLHGAASMRGSSLDGPCFELHCMTREHGYATRSVEGVKYAMIISLKAKKMPQLYNQVMLRYPQLTQLRPATQIQIEQ